MKKPPADTSWIAMEEIGTPAWLVWVLSAVLVLVIGGGVAYCLAVTGAR